MMMGRNACNEKGFAQYNDNDNDKDEDEDDYEWNLYDGVEGMLAIRRTWPQAKACCKLYGQLTRGKSVPKILL